MTQEPDGDPELTTPAGEETVFVGGDTPTTTGPTVGTWPVDEAEQETDRDLGGLVWHATPMPVFDAPPAKPPAGHYLSLVAAVLVVVAVMGALIVVTLNRPTSAVAGSPEAAGPAVPTPGPTSTSGSSEAPPPSEPTALDELADNPLSTLGDAMPTTTCSLPTFRLPDADQETFYEAVEVCADTAWQALNSDLGDITVITVTGETAETPCGAVAPDDPATSCEGTVYLTPAHLRDAENNGRYPGRYLGVALREYAKAVQYRSGLTEDYERAKDDPDASEAELDQRLNAQATCLAGVTAGAMANQGSVDANIVDEIRARLTSVDAPRDAGSWYDKGFRSRVPADCNTWLP